LNNVCRTLVWSARITPRSAGQFASSLLLFLATSGCTVAATFVHQGGHVELFQNRVILPASIFDRVQDVVDERELVLRGGNDFLQVGLELRGAQNPPVPSPAISV